MQITITQANSIDETNIGLAIVRKKKLRLGKKKISLMGGTESDLMIFRELCPGERCERLRVGENHTFPFPHLSGMAILLKLMEKVWRRGLSVTRRCAKRTFWRQRWDGDETRFRSDLCRAVDFGESGVWNMTRRGMSAKKHHVILQSRGYFLIRPIASYHKCGPAIHLGSV